jgi:hypothetical protein
MLSADLRFSGFSGDAWLRLLALLGFDDAPPRENARTSGTLVVVERSEGIACAAFHTQRGVVPAMEYQGSASLQTLCERHGASGAVILQAGVIEEITERAAQRVLREHDYAAQWLALAATVRDLEREGRLFFWPPRTRLPLPNHAVLMRMLDTLLPQDHTLLCMIWEGHELWTGVCVHRRGADIDMILGPEAILDMSGPLGGDFRRDHRAITRAVSSAIAPVHIGLFAQRAQLEALLRDARPGAWARAVTLRDVLVQPAPAYVHVAVSADALRASAKVTSEWLGGIDLMAVFSPLARAVRDQVSQVGSVTALLGWNPLQALATRLRARDAQH